LLSQRLADDAAQSATAWSTAFQSGTSAPVWLDTAAATPPRRLSRAVNGALVYRKPGLQKPRFLKKF